MHHHTLGSNLLAVYYAATALICGAFVFVLYRSLAQALVLSVPILIFAFALRLHKTRATKAVLISSFCVQAILCLLTDWSGLFKAVFGTEWPSLAQRIAHFEENGTIEFLLHCTTALATAVNLSCIARWLTSPKSDAFSPGPA